MTRRQAPSPHADFPGRRQAREGDLLGQATGLPSSNSTIRLQRHAAQLHALGPRATYEFLRELIAGADIFNRLEAYAKLDANTVRALGGDVLPIDRLFVIDGDGS